MKRRSTSRLGMLVLLLLLPAFPALAQDLEFRPPANAADPAAAAIMRDLAVRILPVYQEKDPERYLSNLSALQMVAGDYSSANATRRSLRERRQRPNAARPADRAVLYDVYARARSLEAETRANFPQSFTRAYREIVPRLNDREAFAVTRWFGTPLSGLQETLQRSFDQWRAKGSIPLQQALDVIWTYLSYEAFRSFAPFVGALDDEENRRRYITDEDVRIKTADGATISALLIRPRTAPNPLPTLLEFTIHDSRGNAREAAAHGYAAMVAYARGVRGSTGRAEPFQTDGEDARAVINWVSTRRWSNGRVGMYGDGYSGFAAWAAAKKPTKALKAIATSDATLPGVNLPMIGGVYYNSAYRWLHQVLDIEEPDASTFIDEAQWRAFNLAWYTSGRRYREFATPSGRHGVVFRSWLNHPSYDRFWQRMAPRPAELAKLTIPVLTTTGYFADGGAGALHYFSEHYRHNPRANHTLLIGPYDDGAGQRGTPGVIRGYQIDPVALIELRELRYQWFDSILRGGKPPALLKDRVNYQVMGADEWQHAPSLDAMGNGALRFYLEEDLTSDLNRLSARPPTRPAYLPQTFDLADRSDASWVAPLSIVSRGLKPRNGEVFLSEPLQQATQVAGRLSGRLDFTVNRMDVDLEIALFELLPGGEYVLLEEPYAFRVSYAKDRTRRHLLRAGVRQQLEFKSERLASRRLQAGSRIVVVLGISKRPDRQINYGTGDDVSEETIEDAAIPLRIRWYNTTYVDIPVRR